MFTYKTNNSDWILIIPWKETLFVVYYPLVYTEPYSQSRYPSHNIVNTLFAYTTVIETLM